MVPASLCQLSVATSVEAEDAVMALLGQRFAAASSAYRKTESMHTTVSVFLPALPDAESLYALRASLAGLRAGGLDPRPVAIRTKWIRPEDWAESWKKHFRPLVVERRLVIKPSWSRHRKVPGQRVVVLDPGLSFGTGHHPTTLFCLRRSVVHRPRQEAKSFLDLGTGSGILSIAAAKLGYAPIRAIDHDAEAIRVARQNARRNRVGGRIRFEELDLERASARHRAAYDLVVANLCCDLLIHRARLIASFVGKGGILVLAGILDREFSSVGAAYGACGLQLTVRSSGKEWTSGCFERVDGRQTRPVAGEPFAPRGWRKRC